MFRKSKGEFGVNGVTTQTTQKNDALLSAEDKMVLALVYEHSTMSQREYAMELEWKVDRVKYYL